MKRKLLLSLLLVCVALGAFSVSALATSLTPPLPFIGMTL